MSDTVTSWNAAFTALRDEMQLSDDAIGLLALKLKYRIDDVQAVAAECLTGGGDDKKCDLLYVDKDLQVAIIAQCYVSKKVREAAPANKASDLNTAVAWIMSRSIEDLPDALRGRADEFRASVEAGEIKQLHIWYVHNLPQSKNVSDELKTVEHAAKSALKHYTNGSSINVFAEEIGDKELARLYAQAERTIIVTDEFNIRVPGGVELSTSEWSSVTTYVKAQWIRELYRTYGTDLFSANLRGYLGSRISDSNINYGIKLTAQNEPVNFYVYNNGLTALVLQYELGRRGKIGQPLLIKGISIVNGAQTTGSIGSLDDDVSDDMVVPIRFVRVNKESISNNIVRYNNSQNKLQAADFRSTDQIQDRLRSEFSKVPDAEYDGGRRGGASDVIKRSKYSLPAYTVGQALAAFHGDPVNAYDKKSEIWTSEKLYRQFFTERTTARHIVFCYSLLEEINERKIKITQKLRKDPASVTESERNTYSFLNKKGASYLVASVISDCMETVLDTAIANRTDLTFSRNLSPASAKELWTPLVDLVLSLSKQLDGAFSRGRISNETIKKAVPPFVGIIDSLKSIHKPTFSAFSKEVKISS